MKTSLARMSVTAIAVLVAGGCGSAATHTSARSSPPKLSLAKATARTGAADAAAPGAMPVRPANYVLDGALPDLGTHAAVYRWTAHAVDLAEANRLAAALGIDATATATADGFTASDSAAMLTVTTAYGSTQVSYYPGGNAIAGSGGGSTGSVTIAPAPPIDKPAPVDPSPTSLPPKLTPPVDVPNASEAEGIARTLLDRMGVLDGGHWDSTVTDSGGIAIGCVVGQACSGVPQQVTARDVSFSLVIDGVHVSGVGWNVTIGEHRAIQSVYGEWGAAVVLGSYDLRTTADAFASLQKGDANYGGREPMAVDVPMKARAVPAPADTAVVGPLPPVSAPSGPLPPDSVPTEPIKRVDIHVTGVSLGLARWDAVDGGKNVVDLVPTYVFHTVLDGVSSDVEELALDPAAIGFVDPIRPPTPEPLGMLPPGTVTIETGAPPSTPAP